ncbi:MAG: hypothetical protein IBX61_03395 [Thermoleophilia bacterium]|nr:hypothetical protein [Thermoleophilia bacterium]
MHRIPQISSEHGKITVLGVGVAALSMLIAVVNVYLFTAAGRTMLPNPVTVGITVPALPVPHTTPLLPLRAVVDAAPPPLAQATGQPAMTESAQMLADTSWEIGEFLVVRSPAAADVPPEPAEASPPEPVILEQPQPDVPQLADIDDWNQGSDPGNGNSGNGAAASSPGAGLDKEKKEKKENQDKAKLQSNGQGNGQKK